MLTPARDLKEETNLSASSNPPVGNNKLLFVFCCVYNTHTYNCSHVNGRRSKTVAEQKPVNIQKKPGSRTSTVSSHFKTYVEGSEPQYTVWYLDSDVVQSCAGIKKVSCCWFWPEVASLCHERRNDDIAAVRAVSHVLIDRAAVGSFIAIIFGHPSFFLFDFLV